MENDGLQSLNVLKTQGTEHTLPILTNTTTALLQPQDEQAREPLWRRRLWVVVFHLYLGCVGMAIYSFVKFADCTSNCPISTVIHFVVWTTLAYGPPFVFCVWYWLGPCLYDKCKFFCSEYTRMWREGL